MRVARAVLTVIAVAAMVAAQAGVAVAQSSSSTTVTTGVGGSVSSTLSLSVGSVYLSWVIAPGVAADYSTAVNTTVTSTAGNATLTVADLSAGFPGRPGHLITFVSHMVPFPLPQGLQVSATSPAGVGQPFAPVGRAENPTPLVTWSSPVVDDPVTVTFTQPVAATDSVVEPAQPYWKTMTFALTTTDP